MNTDIDSFINSLYDDNKISRSVCAGAKNFAFLIKESSVVYPSKISIVTTGSNIKGAMIKFHWLDDVDFCVWIRYGHNPLEVAIMTLDDRYGEKNNKFHINSQSMDSFLYCIRLASEKYPVVYNIGVKELI